MSRYRIPQSGNKLVGEEDQRQDEAVDRLTTTVEPIEYILKGTMEWEKVSEVSPNEILGIPDIPLVAHEIVAILCFGTTYELVDYLAKRLQFASNQLTQEHKDWEMIQYAMLSALESEEERE